MRVSVAMLLGICLFGCKGDEEPEAGADFQVRPGVESVTVFGAEPGVALTLYNAEDTALVTMVSDDLGQAHFAYVPGEHVVLDPSNFEGLTLADGNVLLPGEGYQIRNEGSSPVQKSEVFSVLAVDDIPPVSFYESQTLSGIYSSIISGDLADPEEGYQYIEVRDGTLLGAMIRFPDPDIFGPPPYPTVIEYSGYSPSRPDRMDTPSQLANALGYATVSVNFRGSGCSGGVFDVFNRAQHADGYDIVEVVARQDWVLNNQVGMVGLSYPGISQLYVGSTNPPSLAALVPLSTIADAWEMQWPGGVYNSGFTRQWVEEREEQSQKGGSSWVEQRIEEGDTVCAENLELSAHSVDFETFLRGLAIRPDAANDRDLTQLVEQIEAPVFYGGAFHDEQTGAQFGSMLDRFYMSRSFKALIGNGRHPDGYAPHAVYRWFEFLEFYVAERIPVLNPIIRAFGPAEFGGAFGMDFVLFEDDRFVQYSTYEEALAAYEAEMPVRVLFETGGVKEQEGWPVPNYEVSYSAWPPDVASTRSWYLDGSGEMNDTAATESGSDMWRHDADAGSVTFFGASGYQLLEPIWDTNWTEFASGDYAAYLTEPFESSAMLSGPGFAELWVRSPVDDLAVQVTLTEVRPDGLEQLVQTGWLRFGHRASTVGENLRLSRTYDQYDFAPVPIDEWVVGKVVIPSFAHPIREGSRLRMIVSSPGRDHGTWEFEVPEYDAPPVFELGFGGDHASGLHIQVLPDIDIPEDFPACPSLRGQPCRAYSGSSN